MLLCASCANDSRPSLGRPPVERVQEVAAPVIPEATTPCTFDPAELCNTDGETAGAILAYDAALAEANRRIAWLRRWLGFED